jgi:hypothetical protein
LTGRGDLRMNLEAFPQFPSYRQIALSDRQPIQVLFDRFPMGVSERTFGSVFVWRNYERRAELSVLDDHLIISWYKPKFGRVILPPVGQERVEILEALVSPGMKDGHDFYGAFGLLEPDVSNLRSKGKSCESLRDEWDYVYRTKDLIELDGPKYHTQRKELKKATSQLELVFEPMTKAHKQACLELEETWCDMKHCTFDKFSHAEDLALREALANFDELGFLGGVVLADGKVQALTVGEELTRDTAVVHFEKANPSIRGLYQFVNQQFCEHSLKDYEFVNREQDVGEPGLRRAKEGYHPHHFVEKHVTMFR